MCKVEHQLTGNEIELLEQLLREWCESMDLSTAAALEMQIDNMEGYLATRRGAVNRRVLATTITAKLHGMKRRVIVDARPTFTIEVTQ